MPVNQTRTISKKKKGTKRKLALILSCCALAVLIVGFFSYQGAQRYQLWARKQRYPLRYERLILETCQTYDLEPQLVAAIMLSESSFNPEAVSSADARGLMQLMPDTAQWIATKKLNEENFDVQALFTPEVNLRYAGWYLRYLTDRFSGDRVKILAAYNAGQGRVDQWMNDEQISPDGKELTNIPPGETQKYVSKVTEAYEQYQTLYKFDGSGE